MTVKAPAKSKCAARDRDRAGEVEGAVSELRAALPQQQGADRDERDANRDVDEEDPRPGERARQEAAEQHAGRGAAAGDRAPDAERDVALAALGEGRRQDRERGGREQRAAEALGRAEGDQRRLATRRSRRQGADREEGDARDEEPAPAEQVGQAAAEQQEAAEHDRVGGDHPLQALLAEVEVGLDRRQCDVHDRDVEHHHELGCHQRRQCEPAAVFRLARHGNLPLFVATHNPFLP